MNRSTHATLCWVVASSVVVVVVLCSSIALAQTSAPAQPAASLTPTPTPTPSLEKDFFKNILRDQRDIWLSPFHLQKSDVKWVAPLGISTAVLFATDRHTSGDLVEN